MADGWITIETKLATDKFDKQITNLEKKIKSEEKKTELKLKAKLQAEDELKRHKQAIFEIEKEYEKTSQQVEKLQGIMAKQSKGISLTPQDFTDLQSYEQISKENEKIGSTLDKMYAKEVKLNNAVERTSLAYKQTQDNVQGYKTKIESIKINKQQAQVEQLKKGFSKVGNSVDTAVKKIGKMALGIFSVTSAYRLMSSASSTLGQYDEQYATNLEYIRYLIAQAIAPALKYVVNLASTLLSYLNYIAKAWFNVTLFSKNSAKNFAKAQGSTSKMKKDLQTTPFDEMSVLSDTSTSGGGGVTTPSIDPSMIAGEVPEWLKWIADNKELILSVMAGVTAGLLAWRLGLSGIKSLGIGLLITGVILAVQSLIKYLKNPSWENFGKIITGIGLAVAGVALIFGTWPVAVAGAIVAVVGIIISNWNKIQSFLQNGIDWLTSKSDWIHKMFGDGIGDLYDFIVDTIQDTLNSFDGLFSGLKQTFDGIIKVIKGVFTGDWKLAWEGLKDIVVGVFNSLWSIIKLPLNYIISGLNTLIRGANRIQFDVPDWVPGLGGKRFGFNIPTIPKLARGTILNNPGRGVPVAGGRAIAGEAGREAFLPLSDTQLLEELGSTIGRYITINANIVNSMNGRVISRQLQRIQNDNDFAYNT